MRLRRGRSGCGAGAKTSGWQGYGCQSRDVRLPVTLVAVIRLDGSSSGGFLHKLDDVAPEDVRIGMAVEVEFDDVTPQVTLPKFKLRA